MWITALVFVVLLFADQITKFFAVEMGEKTITWGSFLKIHLEYNKGAAFGLGSGFIWVLVVISAVATIVLGYVAIKNDWKHGKFGAIGVSMAFAGALGNLIDRFLTLIGLREGVVDMITLGPWNWICSLFGAGENTFNLADVFLVIGLIILVIDMLFFYDKRARKYGYHSKRK